MTIHRVDGDSSNTEIFNEEWQLFSIFHLFKTFQDRRHIVFYFYHILSKNDRCYVINQKATCNSFFLSIN